MKKNICSIFLIAILVCTGCDDVLDRPQKTKAVDTEFWRNETDLRLYANQYYPNYFVGYNEGWGTAYAPVLDHNFSDDLASSGKQASFENTIPPSRGANTLAPATIEGYAGPNWNFAWVRKSNVFIDRIENEAKANITEDSYKHWMGVARFFRGFEYARLVSVFGDVPYFDHVFPETNEAEMYKDRTPRNQVMEAVYNDFDYALDNIRLDDGAQCLNRYIAAGFISRWMLFEGTWQKYHNNDATLAKKYLELAKKAGDVVINSQKYQISGDFRSLFGSQDLNGNKEVLMYRHYDAGQSVTHQAATFSNAYATPENSPNLDLAKAFLCTDGKPYLVSDVVDAGKLDVHHMVRTRDSRFEATFWDGPHYMARTLLCATKFIDRIGPTYWDSGNIPTMYSGRTNTNDCPVMRYSEILLNWIEAKAELATLGGTAITQEDLRISINEIRDRDLAPEAIAKGVVKTASMILNEITETFAPDRDADVPPLLWEIRRERRMEFLYEHSRLLDIKRWKKLHYMDNRRNPDTMMGIWADLNEVPNRLAEGVKVMKEDGTIVVYDGTNAADMVGYFVPENVAPRDEFSDRAYLAPVGKAEIDQYAEKGYKLTQTTLW